MTKAGHWEHAAAQCSANGWGAWLTPENKRQACAHRHTATIDQQCACQCRNAEGVAISVTQGKALTANVKQVHTEYMAAAGKLQKVAYDVTDTEQPMFQQDFAEYRAVVAELEHRLGSIIFQVSCPCVCHWISKHVFPCLFITSRRIPKRHRLVFYKQCSPSYCAACCARDWIAVMAHALHKTSFMDVMEGPGTCMLNACLLNSPK